MDAIAIFDIGKTNTKVTLVADGRVIEQRRRHSESHPAPPYLHLANDRIWEWALEQLADLARQFNITDIVPVAHGASVAVIDDAGLVLPMLDYELDISDFDAGVRPDGARLRGDRLAAPALRPQYRPAAVLAAAQVSRSIRAHQGDRRLCAILVLPAERRRARTSSPPSVAIPIYGSRALPISRRWWTRPAGAS